MGGVSEYAVLGFNDKPDSRALLFAYHESSGTIKER